MSGVSLDLELRSPWLNAAGFLGFAPTGAWNWPQPQGAFVTNPLSWNPRVPAEQPALLPYPGGFLLHTGWPNPGFRRGLQANARRWAGAQMPIWVHLLAERPHELNSMVRALENVEGVAAIEISLPPELPAGEALFLTRAALGELPLVLSLPLNCAAADWVTQLAGLGVGAVCLAAPRGRLSAGEKPVSGRLYGAALLPQLLETLHALKPLGVPLLAGCGIFDEAAGQAALDAGAVGIQLDAVLWRVDA